MKRTTTLTLCLGSVVGLSALLFAGPLDPPSGPVASSYKTLTEVEPRTAINAANTPGDATSTYKITQPGSYYLTGNIAGEPGKHGIAVESSGVTIDLNGFELNGSTGSGAFDGVSVTVSGLKNIAVLNGTIRGWGGDGIDGIFHAATNCRVEQVLAANNLGNGIALNVAAVVSNCSVRGNTQHGIFISGACVITACSSSGNGGYGINTSAGSVVSNCTSMQNFIGIGTGAGSHIFNCNVNQNSGHGISASGACRVTNCISRSNGADGILCSSDSDIRDNTCEYNGTGGNAANIHATGMNNHITANNCVGAPRGIDIDSSRNIITRNVCSANATNWDVAAGNVILVVNAGTSGAILGNAGGTPPGSTDPNANFSY